MDAWCSYEVVLPDGPFHLDPLWDRVHALNSAQQVFSEQWACNNEVLALKKAAVCHRTVVRVVVSGKTTLALIFEAIFRTNLKEAAS